MNKKFLSWVFYDKTQRCKHFFRIMKLTTVCSLALAFSLHAGNVDSQNVKVTVKQNNTELSRVLTDIEKQTDYLFVYDKYVNTNRKVTVNLKKTPLEDVLDELFEGTDVMYAVDGAYIVLSSQKRSTGTAAQLLSSQQVGKKITGVVKDANGEPIIGANIVEDGTTNGTVTDSEGRFSLHVASVDATLAISFIGYTGIKVSLKGKSSIQVTLQEDTELLDEVVVVGYGTQKKTTLTGAVEVVNFKDLENRPVTSASSLLQGQVAGITFDTPNGGNTPGSNMTLQIRGQASLSGTTPPLVVIDGIPSDMSSFNSLNPSDIASVSVLKDASATAVYGARAPYGVLVVSTKMGEKKEKASITYSTNLGIVTPVRMPKSTDAYTFALLKNQAKLNSRIPVQFEDDKLDLIWDNVNNPGKYSLSELNPGEGDSWGWGNVSYNNNDWFDIWLKSASLRQKHNLSIKGGGNRSSYFVSVGYVNQPSVFNFIENLDNYKRINLNSGIESEVTDWMKFVYRVRYAYGTSKEPGFSGAGRSGLYNWVYGIWPTSTLQYPDGSYLGVVQQSFESGGTTFKQHKFDNIVSADFNLMKGWIAHLDGTWRMNYDDSENISIPLLKTRPSGLTFYEGTSSLSKYNAMNMYWTVQGYSAYEKMFNDHSFRLQVGFSAENNDYRKLNSSANDLFIFDMPSLSIGQGMRNTYDELTEWATVGFFGRLNYNYKERYLLELNGRYDGSGRYSRGNRWGFFPSGFLGWIISNEDFWGPLKDKVNFVKVKASYGTLGNQGGSAGYLHIPTMSVGSQAGWIINGERNVFVNAPGLLNMARTWEKITTLDVGVEVGAIDNRLTGELNFFNRRSWDIIGPASPKPSVLGTSAPEVNNAEFKTKGFELNLSWRDNISPDWNYKIGFMLADSKSKITKYNTTTNDLNGWYVGKEFGEIWGYVSNRLLDKSDFDMDGNLKISQSKISGLWFPGDVKYEDLDGDGEIWSENNTLEKHGDLKKIGNSTPRYRYGINLSSDYKFENGGILGVAIFLEGILKKDIFIANQYYYWGVGGGNTYDISTYQGKHLDFYRDEKSDSRLIDYLGLNKEAYFPRPYDTGEGSKNFQANTRYLENGAYMRLKNIQLTYQLPNTWLSKLKIKNCSIFFSGENLFVISSLPHYLDPEQVGGGRMYPQQATYSFGINVGFN